MTNTNMPMNMQRMKHTPMNMKMHMTMKRKSMEHMSTMNMLKGRLLTVMKSS